MADLAGSAHRPDGLECCQRALMTKLGGHATLPPGATLDRSGWCNSFIVVTTLLRTKMEIHRSTHKSRRKRRGHDRTMSGDLEVGFQIYVKKRERDSLVESPFAMWQHMIGPMGLSWTQISSCYAMKRNWEGRRILDHWIGSSMIEWWRSAQKMPQASQKKWGQIPQAYSLEAPIGCWNGRGLSIEFVQRVSGPISTQIWVIDLWEQCLKMLRCWRIVST